MAEPRPLTVPVSDFLTDLAHSNRSEQTRRAYAAELGRLCSFYRGPIDGLTAEVLRAFFATRTNLAPATRARTQAVVASFLRWAYRQSLITATPMARIDRVQLDPPTPRGLKRSDVEVILRGIPRTKLRDRVLFRLIFETGLRASEAIGIYVKDVDLTTDDEHVTVLGKGSQRRTVLLDDAKLVTELRAYLRQMGYRYGPVFRAEKNGRGGPMRYQSVQARWQQYCAAAGVVCTLHQLRHSHATELVNGGVGLATIRKRLGHKNIQTTLRYAEQSDAAADAELRAWRRRQSTRA